MYIYLLLDTIRTFCVHDTNLFLFFKIIEYPPLSPKMNFCTIRTGAANEEMFRLDRSIPGSTRHLHLATLSQDNTVSWQPCFVGSLISTLAQPFRQGRIPEATEEEEEEEEDKELI
jgi:hypothetical protein